MVVVGDPPGRERKRGRGRMMIQGKVGRQDGWIH